MILNKAFNWDFFEKKNRKIRKVFSRTGPINGNYSRRKTVRIIGEGVVFLE